MMRSQIVGLIQVVALATGAFGAQSSLAQEYYKVTAKHSGYVLDVAFNTMADDGDIVQSYWANTDNQKWQIFYLSGGWKAFAAKSSGKFMDVYNSSTSHAANVVQWGSTLSRNSQQWSIEYVQTINSIPYCQIVNRNSGKCLDVAYFSMAVGGDVIQANCSGGDNQMWILYNLTYGYYGL